AEEERDAERFEVSRRDDGHVDAHAVIGRLGVAFGGEERAAVAAALERAAAGHGSSSDTGDDVEAKEQVLIGGGELRSGVAGVGGIDGNEEDVVGAEAQVEVAEMG